MSRAPGWLPDPENPGAETRWAYSNTNYVLIGMLIERVTGHPWEQEIHERIIEPLGLRHTLTMGTSAYVPQPPPPLTSSSPAGTTSPTPRSRSTAARTAASSAPPPT